MSDLSLGYRVPMTYFSLMAVDAHCGKTDIIPPRTALSVLIPMSLSGRTGVLLPKYLANPVAT